MVIDKNALLMRDASGNLLPIEEESELFGGTVKILPMKLGDFNELKNSKDKIQDEDLIIKHLLEPKLNKDDINNLPLKSRREILTLILITSGLSRQEVEKTMSKAIENLGGLEKN